MNFVKPHNDLDAPSPSKNRTCKPKVVLTGFLLCLGIFFIIGGILVLFHFRDLVNGIIKTKIPLREDSEVTQAWLSPPIKPQLKLYFFNMTNVEDFLSGSKPKLEEIGPYVYDEIWEKVDIRWYEHGEQVEYRQKKTYFFNPTASIGTEGDMLTLPNVPMITAMGGKMRFAGRLVRLALGSMLDILQQKPFVSVSVKDVVWGYDHPLIKLGNDILPPEEKLPFDQFGFFVGKNATAASGLIRALTGIHDVRNVGQILSVDGKAALDIWNGEQCNEIRGTDGSTFHPDITKNDTLYLFNKDLCQSLPLIYQKEIQMNGIPGFRFVPPKDVFSTPSENPQNQCFCLNEGGCLTPSGLFNMSACQFGSPIMLSWPHFYQADPRLLETIEGLSPSEDLHQFFIDIQPKLGTGLRASAKTQVNLVMNAVEDIKPAEGLRDIILPMLWFSDGIDGIDDPDTVALLEAAVHTPETVRSIMYPLLLVLGSVLLILVALYLLKSKCNNNEQEFDVSGMQKSNNLNVGHRGELDDFALKAYKNGTRSLHSRNGQIDDGYI